MLDGNSSRQTGVQPVRRAEEPLPTHIIAASDEMRELVNVIRAIAPTLITVLLIGESGTGKEVLANLIHSLSDRRQGPFVTVNCGAIPEGLIESELFGHEKGSFTGAIGQRKGFFEAANSGTLFLDEIGEMPLNAQVKLLRVLETGKFTRVGSTTELTTDARVIAATNRDLEIDVRAGAFRSDLYYRLRAVMLRIPPLRNRREDIPFLIESILAQLVEKHHLPEMPRLESGATHLLIDHEWRGNVRELRNILEQLVILACSTYRAEGPCVIREADVKRAIADHNVTVGNLQDRSLPVALHRSPPSSEQSERELIYRALIELRAELAEIKELLHTTHASRKQPEPSMPSRTILALPEGARSNGSVPAEVYQEQGIVPLETLERDALRKALSHFEGNRRRAAEALGISERTLYRKLKEQGIE